MSKTLRAFGLAIGALALTQLPAIAQTKVTNEGISANEIVIGTHQDLSGPIKGWGVPVSPAVRSARFAPGGRADAREGATVASTIRRTLVPILSVAVMLATAGQASAALTPHQRATRADAFIAAQQLPDGSIPNWEIIL